jgi:hypothetical protein
MNIIRGLGLVALTFSLSCVWAGDRLYVLEFPQSRPEIGGWTLDLDIFAYKNVSGIDTTRDEYSVGLSLRRLREKKKVALGDITTVAIDSVAINMNKSGRRLVLPLNFAMWVSYVSRDSLEQVFDFTGRSSHTIPLDETHCTLYVFARIFRGQHIVNINELEIAMDSIIIDQSLPPLETKTVQIPIILKDTKHRYPFFLNLH